MKSCKAWHAHNAWMEGMQVIGELKITGSMIEQVKKQTKLS